jgi:Carboxypeptidase regulatory-like domain
VTAMRRMRVWRLPAMALGLTLAVTSCAGGGGSTGTGVSGLTTAQGNVSSVQTSRAASRDPRILLARLLDTLAPVRVADALSGVANVTVRIEGTALSTTSDANGSFMLRGDFGGPITLIFEQAGGSPTRLRVSVPTGGTLTLTDVDLDERSGAAVAASRNLEFDGVVTAANCAASALDMVSEATPNDGNHYPVNVQSATLRDASGMPIACGDLSAGDVLAVQGLVRDDGGVDCDRADRRRHEGQG